MIYGVCATVFLKAGKQFIIDFVLVQLENLCFVFSHYVFFS